MARSNTGPRYFKSKGGYYVTVDGQRYLLARGRRDDPAVRKAAETAYHNLKLQATAAAGPLDDRPCYFLLEAYLAAARGRLADGTFGLRRRYVQGFVDAYGKVRCRDVGRQHAYDHMAARPRWGDASRLHFLKAMGAAFSWGVQQGRITANPFPAVDRPRVTSRAKHDHAYITDEVHQLLVASAPPWTREFLEVLDATGARPGELMRVTAGEWKPELGAFQPKGGKGEYLEKAYGKKRRTVYVPEAARPLVERLVAARPSGPLFRNRDGRPLTKSNLSMWLTRKKAALGIPARVCVVMYRHRFITKALLAGTPVAKVAAIVGNSVATIEKHYNHLDLYGSELKAEVDRLAGQSRKRPGGGRSRGGR